MNIDEIIEGIKNKRIFTIACSWYEEYFWYRDGKFYSSMEDGYHDDKPKGIDEEIVRSRIMKALNNQSKYDACWDFGT